jgi:hypothetical protein
MPVQESAGAGAGIGTGVKSLRKSFLDSDLFSK